MANVYQKILNVSGLTNESQAEGDWQGGLFVLLSALSAAEDANPTADIHVNAVDEILRTRLAPWRNNAFIRERVAPFLTQYHEKFAS